MPSFIDIDQINFGDLRYILELSKSIKAKLKKGKPSYLLKDKHLAMIFEKPSTRTKTSFEVAINQLGGNSVLLTPESSQLGRGESVSDTANVLSRYVEIIMIRCFKHQTLLDLDKNSSVPVINGLSDYSHPCQIMADILTYEEHKGDISEAQIAWFGDFNNVTASWIHAACKFNFKLNICVPKEFVNSNESIIKNYRNIDNINFYDNAVKGAENSDLLTTDTWNSMGDKKDDEKFKLLQEFKVNKSLFNVAKKGAIFMHCLPVYRGYEVDSEIVDGEKSVIFDEAENRLHIQKAILTWCLLSQSTSID